MNILFVSHEEHGEENIRDFFGEINLEIVFMSFKEYTRSLEKIDFITFDFIFVELLGNQKRKVNYIKKCQEQNIALFVNVIYIFENIHLDSLVKSIKLDKFDYMIKPIESKDILEKINTYSNINTSDENFNDYKMIVKGKLIKPLEHQWKQPLNLIATNLLNLEIKSELSKLKHEDVEHANEKVELALNKISNTLSNLNQCFNQSESKTHFSIESAYERVVEFIAPQGIKHNISLNKVENKDNVDVLNYENEFALNILMFLYIFIQWLIEKKDIEKNVSIDFSYEKDDKITNLYIVFNEKLPMNEILNQFNFEFLVIKELLKKIGLIYKSSINEQNTIIKLTL